MSSNQDMQLSKTWLTFVVKDLSQSCKIYGRSGMMQNGIAYQLPPLVRLTDGIESGLWPTPLASAKSDCPSERMRQSPHLETVVKMLPTPTASDATVGDIIGKEDIYNFERKYSEAHQEWDIGESGISKTCKILSDPNCQRLQGYWGSEEISTICKQEQISLYYRTRGIEQWGAEPESIARLKEGRLNPDWVEWLMGFPSSWTEDGSRRQRLMALGNAVVPLIPEFLGAAIMNQHSS